MSLPSLMARGGAANSGVGRGARTSSGTRGTSAQPGPGPAAGAGTPNGRARRRPRGGVSIAVNTVQSSPTPVGPNTQNSRRHGGADTSDTDTPSAPRRGGATRVADSGENPAHNKAVPTAETLRKSNRRAPRPGHSPPSLSAREAVDQGLDHSPSLEVGAPSSSVSSGKATISTGVTSNRISPSHSTIATHRHGGNETGGTRACEAAESEPLQPAETPRVDMKLIAMYSRRREEYLRNVAVDGSVSNGAALSEADLRKLDSSLKKCTSFIRKIRSSGVTEDTVESLIREAQSLNLSRYISEVVNAIAESKARASDAEFATRLCGALHRRYNDFLSLLVPALSAVISSNERDVVARKGSLRLLIELVAVSISHDAECVAVLVKDLARSGRDISEKSMANMSLVATFARNGHGVFFDKPESTRINPCAPLVATNRAASSAADHSSGTDAKHLAQRITLHPHATPTSKECIAEDAQLEVATASEALKGSVLQTLSVYHREVCTLLATAQAQLHTAETGALMASIQRAKGHEQAQARLTKERRTYERLFSAACALADAVGVHAPLRYEFGGEECGSGPRSSGPNSVVVVNSSASSSKDRKSGSFPDSDAGANEPEGPFQSEEERLFYEELPDIAALLAGTTHEKAAGDDVAVVSEDKAHSSLAPEKRPDISPGSTKASSGPKSSPSSRHRDRVSGSGQNVQASSPETLDSVLARMRDLGSASSVDGFVVDFCRAAASSRSTSKRLLRQLQVVGPNMMTSLPSYARVAASLKGSFPEVAAMLVSALEEELRVLIAKSTHDVKSTSNYIRAARYLGECIKFGLAEQDTFFEIAELCLKDFAGHKVEICCHLLESCGRFLSHSSGTSLRTKRVLDTVWRLKSVRNLEARYNALVETAYFTVRPQTPNGRSRTKRRDPMHEFIRWRIYVHLSPENVDKTAKLFRKLPWDRNLELYTVEKCLAVDHLKFSMLACVARLVALISKDRSSISVAVVDGLLESIRCGLDSNDGRQSQRRVAEIVFLGELLNCGVVNAPVVYQQLYDLISSSQPGLYEGGTMRRDLPESDQNASTAMNYDTSAARDPPNDYFRVRLTCALLDTCGQRLVCPPVVRKKSSVRQMEVFWTYFERYVFAKAVQSHAMDRAPVHINNCMADTFERMMHNEGEGSDTTKFLSPLDLRHKLRPPSNPVPHMERQNKLKSKAADATSYQRPQNLAEAAQAIEKIENCRSDALLVCMPQRRYGAKSQQVLVDSPSHSPGALLKAFPPNTGPGMGAHVPIEDEAGVEMDEDDDDDESDDDSQDQSTGSQPGDDTASVTNASGVASADDFDQFEDGSSSDEDTRESMSDSEGDDNYLIPSTRQVRTEEEDEFDRELAALTAAEAQSAKASFTGHTALDRLAIPIGLMSKHDRSKRSSDTMDPATTGANDVVEETKTNSSETLDASERLSKKRNPADRTMAFKMLVRRGGKSQLRDLEVPSGSSIAVAAQESSSQHERNHAEVKRLVLESNAVVNAEEEDAEDESIGLDAMAANKEKVRTINEQRAEDEHALLRTVYRKKGR